MDNSEGGNGLVSILENLAGEINVENSVVFLVTRGEKGYLMSLAGMIRTVKEEDIKADDVFSLIMSGQNIVGDIIGEIIRKRYSGTTKISFHEA